MKKASILSGVVVFSALAALLVFNFTIHGRPKGSEVPIVLGVLALAFILPAFFVFLGGQILKKNKGAFRLGFLLSVVWFFGVLVATEPYDRYGDVTEFLLIAILPVIAFWGTIWVINGFIGDSKNKDDALLN